MSTYTLKTAMGRLRLFGITEGISFLVLLFIAMPLKYGAGIDEAVSITGMLHGVLFIIYLIGIANAFFVKQLSFFHSFLAVLAAFLPFGPFLLDRKLR
ncbi:DUF3817 domain-containing protein [Paenibacillus sp. KS-LC4]|uniref:DUF3817 domain-containing protein n=1 Tax=Paenibacillus sp. KS-LC4 TaxID=2979727 RepID=UPI0030D392F1